MARCYPTSTVYLTIHHKILSLKVILAGKGESCTNVTFWEIEENCSLYSQEIPSNEVSNRSQ